MAAVGEPERSESRWRIALEAARPRTLPAAVAPVLVGSALAARAGGFRAGVALAALATALALQVAANLANDLFDFRRGVDTERRVGPRRVTQSGLVSPRAMAWATAGAAGVAAVLGLGLIARGGWPIAALGAAALATALLYTGGPWPLADHGLGDLAVFLFFGPVGVAGTAYVQALALARGVVPAALAVGLLTTAILAVNNLRDIETDARAGRRTLAVRWGAPATRFYIAALLGGAHVAIALAVARDVLPAGALLALASLPPTLALIRRIASSEGAELNPCLAATARLDALFAALLGLGIVL